MQVTPGGIAPASSRRTRWIQLTVVVVLILVIFRTLQVMLLSSSTSSSASHLDQTSNERRRKRYVANEPPRGSIFARNRVESENEHAEQQQQEKKLKIEHIKQAVQEHEQHLSPSEKKGEDAALSSKFLLLSNLRRAAAYRELNRDGRPRACFLSLVRHTADGLRRFSRLLSNVQQSLPLMAQRYPFVAFVEPSGDENDVLATINSHFGFARNKKTGNALGYSLTHVFPGGVIVAKIAEEDWRIPLWVRSEDHGRRPWPYPSTSYWGVPYRFMCRLFSTRIMFQDALHDFDYYLRFDTDSFVLARPMTTVIAPHPRSLDRLEASLKGDSGEGEHGHVLVEKRLDADAAAVVPRRSDGKQHAANEVASLSSDDLTEFLRESREWIVAAHGVTAEEQVKAQEREKKKVQQEQQSPSAALRQLGFIEYKVDVDYFLDAAAGEFKYAFNMLHPQTIPQFLRGLWEMYDSFFVKELESELSDAGAVAAAAKATVAVVEGNEEDQNADEGGDDSKPPSFLRRRRIVMRRSSDEQPWASFSEAAEKQKQSDAMHDNRNQNSWWWRSQPARRNGPNQFAMDRGIGMGFWDNFEIVSLSMFRLRKEDSKFAEGGGGFDSNNNKNKKYKPLPTSHLPPHLHEIHERAIRVFAKAGGILSHHGGSSAAPQQAEIDAAVVALQRRRELNAKVATERHNLRAAAIGRFLEHVDRAGGIFLYRWGDAEIRTLTVALFVHSTEVAWAESLPYQHYHNFNCAQPPSSSNQQQQQQDQLLFLPALLASRLRKLGFVDGFASSTSLHAAVASGREAAAKQHSRDAMHSLSKQLVNKILLSSAEDQLEAYSVAKTLSSVSALATDTRSSLLQQTSTECNRVANIDYNKQVPQSSNKYEQQFRTKGRGSAAMRPAEHDHNNAAFWKFVAQQGEGYLSI